jgi:hypothetical protein
VIDFGADHRITLRAVEEVRAATARAHLIGVLEGPFQQLGAMLAELGRNAINPPKGDLPECPIPLSAGDLVLWGTELLETLEELTKPAEDEEPSDAPRGSSRLEEHFIDRTLGPTSEEVLEILTVTQVALSQERSRVKRHARGILALYQSLPERGSPEDYTRVRAELRAWLERSTVYSPEDLALAPPAESAEVAS